ncbi:MAG: hypothetical protein GX149_05145, partial [Acholeplasmataceae bacterium]|nr:hypothetical protein [Acholeplasmataceae bacterium]
IGQEEIVPDLGGILNGDFSNGLFGWFTWYNDSQDVDVEYSVVDGEAVVNIIAQAAGEGGLDNNWWDVQIGQKSISFDKLESLKLIFTARAENPRKMMVNIQGGGLAQKAIDSHMVSLTTEDQTFEIEFFGKTAAVNAELQFALGTFHKVDGVPEGEQTVLGKVYLSDVKIVEGPELENQPPVITAPNVILRIDTAEFDLLSGVSVEDDRDILEIKDVSFEDITEGEKFSLPAKEGVYIIKYSVTDSEGLVGEATRAIVVKDPFVLPSFDEVAPNGAPVGWEFWGEDTHGGLEVSTENGEVTIEITNVDGGDLWHNQFKTLGLAAYSGSYVLEFTAKADAPRPVVVAMEGDGGVGILNLNVVKDLTENWETYTIEFEIENNAIYDNRNLQFWFGDMAGVEGYSAADNVLTKVYLKDVSITLKQD